jgi:hypothetical protein
MYPLNAKWVYAAFDVSPRIVQRLYEYAVRDDGTIRWKVIDTYLTKK